jgi:chemotaxis protein methyltransferase CheR
MLRLTIIEYREIVKTVKEFYQVDLSNYTLSSLKRGFEKVISSHNLKNAGGLIRKISADKTFKDTLLREISLDDIEMFRDPSLWREMRDSILPKLSKNPYVKIWIPESVNGEEVYTLSIVLKETGIYDKTKLFVSSYSKQNIDSIRERVYSKARYEINNTNYKRYSPNKSLADYFDFSQNQAAIKSELLKNVTFLHINMFKDTFPTKVHLVLFRNKLIYFNQPLQVHAVNVLQENLLPGGFFIIGTMENLEKGLYDKKFLTINRHERIFKKLI